MKKTWSKTFTEIEEHHQTNVEVLKALNILRDYLLKYSYELEKEPEKAKTSTRFPLPQEVKLKDAIALFTDGACRGNPGPGAWGCFAQDFQENIIFEASSFEKITTNNKMELTAVIAGLKQILNWRLDNLPREIIKVHVYSDSKYVIDGINQWVPGWLKNNWRKSDNKAPENLDLWKELYEQSRFPGMHIQFHWVRGHNGHPQNEYCDQMCQEVMNQILGS